MALPESFQIALQRAKTERELEQEQVLSTIGDTIRQGVPLLSGVLAGALSRSPIIGIGTAFIADKLKQRSEEKREQRRASRLEMRQRREAAKILSAQNEDMSFRDALRLIEEKAVEKQQELNRQREEQLLDQFDVNNLQRQVAEQEAEQVGEQVQVQDQFGVNDSQRVVAEQEAGQVGEQVQVRNQFDVNNSQERVVEQGQFDVNNSQERVIEQGQFDLNNLQRQNQVQNQFGVNYSQRVVSEQEAEQIGEPVRQRDQGISSTLEDTFMRIDENITGILDLLVEKFGTDEQRAERAEARQAFLDARRREELAEIARNAVQRPVFGEPERSPEEDSRPSFLQRVGGFLKNLFSSKFILIPIAAALATLFSGPLIDLYNEYFGPNGKFRPEIEAIGTAIENRIKQAYDYFEKKFRSLLDEILSPFPKSIRDAILGALGLKEDEPETPEQAASRTNAENIALSTAVGTGVLRETPFDRTARQVRERLLGSASFGIGPTVAPQQAQPSLGRRFITGTGDLLRRRVAPLAIAAGAYDATVETDPELYGLGDLVRDLGVPLPGGAENQRPFFGDGLDKGVERLFDAIIDAVEGRRFKSEDLLVNPETSNLGANLNTVSGNQTAFNFSPIIAPQTSSSTTVNQSKTTNLNGSPINPYPGEYKFQTNRTMTG